jgi:hypothetical protein
MNDNKDWDDYPVNHECGSCAYFDGGICTNPVGYRYDDEVYFGNDACRYWEDGQ